MPNGSSNSAFPNPVLERDGMGFADLSQQADLARMIYGMTSEDSMALDIDLNTDGIILRPGLSGSFFGTINPVGSATSTKPDKITIGLRRGEVGYRHQDTITVGQTQIDKSTASEDSPAITEDSVIYYEVAGDGSTATLKATAFGTPISVASGNFFKELGLALWNDDASAKYIKGWVPWHTGNFFFNSGGSCVSALDPSEEVLGTLVAWWDGNRGVYSDAGVTLALDGEGVFQWNDQSGNGHHLTQATAGLRPTYDAVVASANGQSGVAFDGTELMVAASKICSDLVPGSGSGAFELYFILADVTLAGGGGTILSEADPAGGSSSGVVAAVNKSATASVTFEYRDPTTERHWGVGDTMPAAWVGGIIDMEYIGSAPAFPGSPTSITPGAIVWVDGNYNSAKTVVAESGFTVANHNTTLGSRLATSASTALTGTIMGAVIFDPNAPTDANSDLNRIEHDCWVKETYGSFVQGIHGFL